jgi:GTP-binding protein
VLLHLVSAREDDPAAAYRTVRGELEAYAHGLAGKPEIVALSQADTVDAAERKEKAAALKRAAGRAPLILSAATHEGVDKVLRALMEVIEKARTETTNAPSEGTK